MTFKVFNRLTGEDITDLFKYLVDSKGVLYLFDELLGCMHKATHVHEIRYDR